MTQGNPPDLSYAEPDLRAIPEDPYGRVDPRIERSGTGGRVILLLGILLLAAGLGWWLWTRYYATPPASIADATPPPPSAAAPKEPGVQHPIESTAPAEPLPALADSDKALAAALASAIDSEAIARLMVSQDFVRRFVVTVDNLPRKTYAQRLSPMKPTPGQFGVTRASDALRISPQNIERYALAVRTLEAVNSEKLVAMYVRYYPLFQEAYKEQGYPNAYFNDRLVEALDIMIATRESPGQLALQQPKVLYEYADPALESLPAGQKIMLRMGPENAARVKVKLKEIRALVAKEGNTVKAAKSP